MIIMGSHKSYFSGEHIAPSLKEEKKLRCEHILRKPTD